MILKFNIFDSTKTGNETDTFNLFFDFMKGKVKFIRETQILKAQCIEICKLNNPAEGGGFHTRDSRIYPYMEWKWEENYC
jgi:hypothetical protein